jgi:hypothetical protein
MLEFLDDGFGKISLKTQTFIHGNKHIYFAFQVMKNTNMVETPFSVFDTLSVHARDNVMIPKIDTLYMSRKQHTLRCITVAHLN